MTGRDCAQETAHRKYNRIGDVEMPRGRTCFRGIFIAHLGGEGKGRNKKDSGFPGRRRGHGKDIFYINRDKAEGKVVLVTERGVLCKVCKKSLAKQNGQAAD